MSIKNKLKPVMLSIYKTCCSSSSLPRTEWELSKQGFIRKVLRLGFSTFYEFYFYFLQFYVKRQFSKTFNEDKQQVYYMELFRIFKEAKSTRKFDIVNVKVNDNLNVIFYFFYDFNGHTAYLIYIVLETKWKIWWWFLKY